MVNQHHAHADGEQSGHRGWVREAHPFFWTILLAAATAAAVALTVKGHSPGYAFDSVLVYRFEVGFASLLALYALVLLLWLAYQGRSVRVQIGPGAMEGPDPAEGLNEAAAAFEDFKRDANERLDTHDDNFESLDARLSDLEGRRQK